MLAILLFAVACSLTSVHVPFFLCAFISSSIACFHCLFSGHVVACSYVAGSSSNCVFAANALADVSVLLNAAAM